MIGGLFIILIGWRLGAPGGLLPCQPGRFREFSGLAALSPRLEELLEFPVPWLGGWWESPFLDEVNDDEALRPRMFALVCCSCHGRRPEET